MIANLTNKIGDEEAPPASRTQVRARRGADVGEEPAKATRSATNGARRRRGDEALVLESTTRTRLLADRVSAASPALEESSASAQPAIEIIDGGWLLRKVARRVRDESPVEGRERRRSSRTTGVGSCRRGGHTVEPRELLDGARRACEQEAVALLLPARLGRRGGETPLRRGARARVQPGGAQGAEKFTNAITQMLRSPTAAPWATTRRTAGDARTSTRTPPSSSCSLSTQQGGAGRLKKATNGARPAFWENSGGMLARRPALEM